MVNNLEAEATISPPAAETTVTDKSQTEGLPNREALEKAISENRGSKDGAETKPQEKTVTPTSKDVQAAVKADPEPPAEFSKEGKEAWKNKDVAAIQKEFRRIHDSRTQEIGRSQQEARQAKLEAQKEKEDAKTWRELGAMAAPYIEAQGAQGKTPQQAIMNALSLITAFQKADPATAKAELKRIGIDLDKAPGQTVIKDSALEAKIDALQKRQDQIDNEKRQQEFQQIRSTFDTAFATLKSQKTRTGEPVFPDLFDESEKGMKRARRIGSRVKDPEYQQEVLDRFPDADFTVLVREAYISEYGRVSGQPVTQVSQSNQKHIEKARRAVASTPGRIATRNDTSNLVGKLGRRAALAQAIADRREH